MVYTDTRDSSVNISFRDAVMEGMSAKTGGLYVPRSYPRLPESFLGGAPAFTNIACEGAKLFTGSEIPDADLERLIRDAYPFDAPVVELAPETWVLELFHGPTCAFKDFGARFMARVMSYFNRDQKGTLHILVATSGDTGSAVGSAFQDVPGIDVTILFPRGKISPLQEKQLSTFTGNIRSLRVDGAFDDCQKLVKTAFTDGEVRKKLRLSSANSINIARLLPQSFYYIHGALSVAHRRKKDPPAIIAVVPSGNFGDLTSGLIARRMGAPIGGFVAATNANKTVPDWMRTGEYTPRPSVQTLSNAMDVGAPSNFERMTSMYSLDEFRSFMTALWFNDRDTLSAIKACREKHGYLLDPHGAVGYAAWESIRRGEFGEIQGGGVSLPAWAGAVREGRAAGILLETAHPAKFGDTVQEACGVMPDLPESLKNVLALPDRAITMQNDYARFKTWLLDTHD
ncbi:MAG: threonine synthase [Spirochaetaceae bacterium]|jgi:threonine synthase|nr:threonine synthase [Spirochaetaceae bacterium]